VFDRGFRQEHSFVLVALVMARAQAWAVWAWAFLGVAFLRGFCLGGFFLGGVFLGGSCLVPSSSSASVVGSGGVSGSSVFLLGAGPLVFLEAAALALADSVESVSAD